MSRGPEAFPGWQEAEWQVRLGRLVVGASAGRLARMTLSVTRLVPFHSKCRRQITVPKYICID
jgi:hypothetical protein